MERKIYLLNFILIILLTFAACGKSENSNQNNDPDAKPIADSIDEYLDLNAIYPRYNQNITVGDEDIWMYSYNVYSDKLTWADYENIAKLQYDQSEVKNVGEKEFHKFEGKFSFIFFDGDTDTVLDKFMAQEGKRMSVSDDNVYLEADQKYEKTYINGTESKLAPGDKD